MQYIRILFLPHVLHILSIINHRPVSPTTKIISFYYFYSYNLMMLDSHTLLQLSSTVLSHNHHYLYYRLVNRTTLAFSQVDCLILPVSDMLTTLTDKSFYTHTQQPVVGRVKQSLVVLTCRRYYHAVLFMSMSEGNTAIGCEPIDSDCVQAALPER